MVDLLQRGVEAALGQALAGQQHVAFGVGVGRVAVMGQQQELRQREKGRDPQRYLTIAILHTVPFLPSAVAVNTV